MISVPPVLAPILKIRPLAAAGRKMAKQSSKNLSSVIGSVTGQRISSRLQNVESMTEE